MRLLNVKGVRVLGVALGVLLFCFPAFPFLWNENSALLDIL